MTESHDLAAEVKRVRDAISDFATMFRVRFAMCTYLYGRNNPTYRQCIEEVRNGNFDWEPDEPLDYTADR